MVRERARVFLESVGVELFERPRGRTVNRLAAMRQEPVVRDVLRQRVLEHVDRLLVTRRLVQKLQALQLEQMGMEWARAVPHPVQQLRRELAPENRGALDEALGGVGQPIDARHDHALDGIGNDLIGATTLRHREGQLFEKERIAFGLGEDRLGYRARHGIRPQHGSHDRETGLAGQGSQREVRGVGAIDPRRPVPGPIRRDEKDRRRREALDEERQILLGSLVDPVQVLHEEDDGASPAPLRRWWCGVHPRGIRPRGGPAAPRRRDGSGAPDRAARAGRCARATDAGLRFPALDVVTTVPTLPGSMLRGEPSPR